MNDRIDVNVEELKRIADSMQNVNEEIFNLYKVDIVNVLNESRECIKVSGLDFSNLESSFKTLFTSLNNQLTNLTTTLTKNVIPNYQNTIDVISKIFNSDFASEMENIISEINS